MQELIADKYIINISDLDTEFYYGDKNGVMCWPLRYNQGCYGDCPDCRTRWAEKLRLLGDLPLDLLKEKEVKAIRLRKVLIHTEEDGKTHWTTGAPMDKTLCGKKLHPACTVYTPKLSVICEECEAEKLAI